MVMTLYGDTLNFDLYGRKTALFQLHFLSFNFLFHHKKPEKIEEGRETEDEEDDEEEDEQEKETETVVEKRELDKFAVETRKELAYFR